MLIILKVFSERILVYLLSENIYVRKNNRTYCIEAELSGSYVYFFTEITICACFS